VRIPAQGRTIIVLTNQHRFFPMLAERLADLTLPEPPVEALAEDRPSVAANLKGLFNALAAGADNKAFVAKGSDPGEPLRSGFGKAMIDAVGPVGDAKLIRVEPDGSRVYHLEFQRKHWDWSVKADADGRIMDMQPS
jgi:hypothetical protein